MSGQITETPDPTLQRRRALWLTLPAAAVLAVPTVRFLPPPYSTLFGFWARYVDGPVLGWGMSLLFLLTIWSSSSAIRACWRAGNERFLLVAGLTLFNLSAVGISCLGLYIYAHMHFDSNWLD